MLTQRKPWCSCCCHCVVTQPRPCCFSWLSMCSHSPSLRVFADVSVFTQPKPWCSCWCQCVHTVQALVFLLVVVCCDTAQALVFLLVVVCCDTAQALVFLLVVVCCDTAQALVFLLVVNALTQPKLWCFCWCQCVVT